MHEYTVYVDGSAKENGLMSVGAIGYTQNNKSIFKISKCIGKKKGSNISMIAEYEALKIGLEACKTLNIDNILVYSDFITLVNNLTGKEYGKLDKSLIKLYEEIVVLKSQFKNIDFKYIPSNQNQAHKLAYSAKEGNNIEDFNLSLISKSISSIVSSEEAISVQEAAISMEPTPPILKNINISNESSFETEMLQFMINKNNEILKEQEKLNKLMIENQFINKIIAKNLDLKETVLKSNQLIIEKETKLIKKENELLDKEKQINLSNIEIDKLKTKLHERELKNNELDNLLFKTKTEKAQLINKTKTLEESNLKMENNIKSINKTIEDRNELILKLKNQIHKNQIVKIFKDNNINSLLN